MKLAGKVAIVTGGASGIGREIVHVFAREGAKVVIADINVDGAERVTEEARVMGGVGLGLMTDVSKEEDVSTMVQRAIAKFGKIDILVNNAAYVSVIPKYFHESDPSEWDVQIDVDFKGVLYCCRAVIPHMIAQRGGRIITIGSNAGKATPSKYAVYGACKAAVAGFSRCLARELGRYNILVNCVSPGTIRTPATESKSAAKAIEAMAAATILRRIGEPEDVANMVLFLASEDGKYITAQNYSVDGGMTCSH